MKDLQFRDLQAPVIGNIETLAILRTCKKIDGELLTTGTVVANGTIDPQDQERFGLEVRIGSLDETELDLSKGAALGLAMDILEHFGMSAGEFTSWIADRKAENTPGDRSHWFLVD